MSKIGFLPKIFVLVAAWLSTRRRIPRNYSLDNSAGYKWNFCVFSLRYKNDPDFERFAIFERPGWQGISGRGYSKHQIYAIGTEPSDPRPPSEGIEWIEANMSLPFKSLGNYTTQFTRVYGSQSITYSSIFNYLLAEAILLHFWMDINERILRWWFESRFKFAPERVNVLIQIVEWRRQEFRNRRIGSLRKQFSHIDFFTVIATWRAWGLSDHLTHLEELKFILDSWVVSGELSQEPDGRYSLNAKSLATISAYETDNRKQRRSEWNNKGMLFLTLVLAATAFFELLLKSGFAPPPSDLPKANLTAPEPPHRGGRG